MRYFHIISVGVSIIENFKRTGQLANRPVSDNNFWEEKLNDSGFLNDLYDFVSMDPKRTSAELNSFLSIVEKESNSKHKIYFVGTKTPINEICVRILEKFMKNHNFEIFNLQEISGYFLEEEKFSHHIAANNFTKEISLLIDRLIYITKKRKQEGYKVIFNPTGGLKAHVISCAIAGFLTDSPVYYIHEEFKDVIQLPSLFYIPKGNEIEILQKLSSKQEISELELEQFAEEIERLTAYHLVEIYNDEVQDRIKITNKGLLILEELKEK